MIHTGSRISLVALLFSLACPQGLLGLNTAPPAREFFCNASHGDAGPDWLVGRGPSGEHGTMLPLGIEECAYVRIAVPSMRLGELTQNGVGRATLVDPPSAWKQAGIYGLEFAGAAVASTAGAVGAYWAGAALSRKGDVWYVPGVATAYVGSALTGIVLSALSAHLIGKLLGRGGSFSHALAGGAVGGVAGGGVLLAFGYSGQTGAPCWPLLPIGLALPAAGAVTIYSVWRNNETK